MDGPGNKGMAMDAAAAAAAGANNIYPTPYSTLPMGAAMPGGGGAEVSDLLIDLLLR